MATVTVTLNMDDPKDLKLLELITLYKSGNLSGRNPSLTEVATQVTPKRAGQPEAAPDLGQAADNLARVAGVPGRKLTTKERASVAAKSRWERHKALKEGRTPPPTSKELKAQQKKSGTLDYSRAQEEDSGQYEEEQSDDINSMLGCPPDEGNPDARQIMSGMYRMGGA